MDTLTDLVKTLETLPKQQVKELSPKDQLFLSKLGSLAVALDGCYDSSILLPPNLIQEVQASWNDPTAMQVLLEDLFRQVFGNLQPHTQQEQAPDDEGRCVQGSLWFVGTICLPTDRCLVTDLGCSPGILKVGWCFEQADQGCKCERKELPIALLLVLLAIAGFYFGPALIGPVQTFLQRQALRLAAGAA